MAVLQRVFVACVLVWVCVCCVCATVSFTLSSAIPLCSTEKSSFSAYLSLLWVEHLFRDFSIILHEIELWTRKCTKSEKKTTNKRRHCTQSHEVTWSEVRWSGVWSEDDDRQKRPLSKSHDSDRFHWTRTEERSKWIKCVYFSAINGCNCSCVNRKASPC